MKESVIEETPYAIINNKKNDTMHFVTPSFRTIKVWHCVQCGKKYDKHHSGEFGNNKFGEVIETYRDGSHTACCL